MRSCGLFLIFWCVLQLEPCFRGPKKSVPFLRRDSVEEETIDVDVLFWSAPLLPGPAVPSFLLGHMPLRILTCDRDVSVPRERQQPYRPFHETLDFFFYRLSLKHNNVITTWTAHTRDSTRHLAAPTRSHMRASATLPSLSRGRLPLRCGGCTPAIIPTTFLHYTRTGLRCLRRGWDCNRQRISSPPLLPPPSALPSSPDPDVAWRRFRSLLYPLRCAGLPWLPHPRCSPPPPPPSLPPYFPVN